MTDSTATIGAAEGVALVLVLNRLRSAWLEAGQAKSELVAVSVADLGAALAELKRLRDKEKTAPANADTR